MLIFFTYFHTFFTWNKCLIFMNSGMMILEDYFLYTMTLCKNFQLLYIYLLMFVWSSYFLSFAFINVFIPVIIKTGVLERVGVLNTFIMSKNCKFNKYIVIIIFIKQYKFVRPKWDAFIVSLDMLALSYLAGWFLNQLGTI